MSTQIIEPQERKFKSQVGRVGLSADLIRKDCENCGSSDTEDDDKMAADLLHHLMNDLDVDDVPLTKLHKLHDYLSKYATRMLHEMSYNEARNAITWLEMVSSAIERCNDRDSTSDDNSFHENLASEQKLREFDKETIARERELTNKNKHILDKFEAHWDKKFREHKLMRQNMIAEGKMVAETGESIEEKYLLAKEELIQRFDKEMKEMKNNRKEMRAQLIKELKGLSQNQLSTPKSNSQVVFEERPGIINQTKKNNSNYSKAPRATFVTNQPGNVSYSFSYRNSRTKANPKARKPDLSISRYGKTKRSRSNGSSDGASNSRSGHGFLVEKDKNNNNRSRSMVNNNIVSFNQSSFNFVKHLRSQAKSFHIMGKEYPVNSDILKNKTFHCRLNNNTGLNKGPDVSNLSIHTVMEVGEKKKVTLSITDLISNSKQNVKEIQFLNSISPENSADERKEDEQKKKEDNGLPTLKDLLLDSDSDDNFQPPLTTEENPPEPIDFTINVEQEDGYEYEEEEEEEGYEQTKPSQDLVHQIAAALPHKENGEESDSFHGIPASRSKSLILRTATGNNISAMSQTVPGSSSVIINNPLTSSSNYSADERDREPLSVDGLSEGPIIHCIINDNITIHAASFQSNSSDDH